MPPPHRGSASAGNEDGFEEERVDEQFFVAGTKRGIQATHADRLRLILGRLSVATAPADMGLPGLGLHELQGVRRSTWAVKVSGNWRVTFAFAGVDVTAVDYEDYH